MGPRIDNPAQVRASLREQWEQVVTSGAGAALGFVGKAEMGLYPPASSSASSVYLLCHSFMASGALEGLGCLQLMSHVPCLYGAMGCQL